jgi:uncharacterized protein
MMSDNENLAILERFYKLIVDGDVESAVELLHPDYVLHEPAGLPYGGTFKGQDGFLQMGAAFNNEFDLTVNSWRAYGAGDVVFAAMTVSLRSKSTGREIDTSILELYRFTDGRISEMDVYYKDPGAVAETAAAA